MKKLICAAFLAIAMLLAVPLSGYAGGPRVYFGVNVGMGHPGYWKGHPRVWRAHPGWWGPRFYWRGPVVIRSYPYYIPPPVVIQQHPPVTALPEQPQENYWYYCPDPQGYYPYVQSCPEGWMKVVPQLTPPGAPPDAELKQ